MKPLITIIVPCFNEAENIDRLIEELDRLAKSLSSKYKFEFLFTDNHSADGTFEQLSAYAHKRKSMRIVRFARNFGFQKSVFTGYLLAKGEAAVQIDADLQDPPSLISDFLDKWQNGYDVVVGVRRKRRENWVLMYSRELYYQLMIKLDGPHLTETFGTERLTGALLDRLTHHVTILEMNGESYRLKHSQKKTKPPQNPA